MNNETAEVIISNENNVMVSILCLTYNHEDYIKQCLEGFAMQKTDFAFEALVHEDASTDGTAAILREMEQKYPDIIKPIYQTENQYSKKVGITKNFLMPRAKGKYLAICEGDDCWTDPYKLQKQVDYMEAHPECMGCVGGTTIINYAENEKKNDYYPTEASRYVSMKEVLCDGAEYPTNTFLYRRELREKYPNIFEGLNLGFGDYPRIINMRLAGEVYAFHEIFSVYRYKVKGSWTARNMNEIAGLKKNRDKRAMMYEVFNEHTNNQYKDVTDNILLRHDFNILLRSGDKKALKQPLYNELYKAEYGFTARTKRALTKLFPFLPKLKKRLMRHE